MTFFMLPASTTVANLDPYCGGWANKHDTPVTPAGGQITPGPNVEIRPLRRYQSDRFIGVTEDGRLVASGNHFEMQEDERDYIANENDFVIRIDESLALPLLPGFRELNNHEFALPAAAVTEVVTVETLEDGFGGWIANEACAVAAGGGLGFHKPDALVHPEQQASGDRFMFRHTGQLFVTGTTAELHEDLNRDVPDSHTWQSTVHNPLGGEYDQYPGQRQFDGAGSMISSNSQAGLQASIDGP